MSADITAACTPPTVPADNQWRHSSTRLYLLSTPAMIKGQCACSAFSLDCVPLAAGWSSNSVQTTNINKVSILISISQQCLSYWLISRTWNSRLWRYSNVHSCCRLPECVFKRPTIGKKYQFLTPEWMKQLTTGVIGMTVMYYIQSWKLWYIARHHLLLQSIASILRKQFISGRIEHTDITQLGCLLDRYNSTGTQLHVCMSKV